MQTDSIFELIPIWAVFLGTFIFVLIAIQLGYRLGLKHFTTSHLEKITPVGSNVGAVLALLALLLAFTFSFAAEKFENRKKLVVEEANAIQTALLRSSLVSKEHRIETARLLHEYINVRLEAVRSQNISPAVKESVKIHSQLWSLVESANKKSPQSVSTEIFAESVNELISVHSKRIQITSLGKIPDLIWLTLYIVTFISLGTMGYHSGLSGSKRSITTPCVAFTFAIVLLLIVDIDRPQQGLLKVSQQPIENLLDFIKNQTVGTAKVP